MSSSVNWIVEYQSITCCCVLTAIKPSEIWILWKLKFLGCPVVLKEGAASGSAWIVGISPADWLWLHLFTASLFTDIRRTITKTSQRNVRQRQSFRCWIAAEIWWGVCSNGSSSGWNSKTSGDVDALRQWWLLHFSWLMMSRLYKYAFWKCSLLCQWIMHLLNFVSSCLSSSGVTTPEWVLLLIPLHCPRVTKQPDTNPTQLNPWLWIICPTKSSH